MERAEVVLARGRSQEISARRSSTRLGTPWWASSTATARPTGPPPAMTTGAARGSGSASPGEAAISAARACPS